MSLADRYKLSVLNIVLKVYQLKKAETMSLEQLEDLQRKRFIKMLKHAIKHSKFYRGYYQEHGINLKNIDEVTVKDLPVINKEIVMENFDQLVCDSDIKKKEIEAFICDPHLAHMKYKNKYEVIHTSGSSGRIGIFVYGPNDWSILKALVFTRVSKNKLRLSSKAKYAFIGAIDGHYAGISLAKDSPKFLFDFLPVDINGPLHESVTRLNSFMPECLCGYASGVYLLALEQLKGSLKIRPERIVCSADPLTDDMAETIYKAFNVKPINFYAATESLGMAAQCDLHEGFHMFNDWHIFESIKQNGEATKPGEPGSLVITNLYNYTQPLIRYRMDDEVILQEKGCSCGWPFPVFSKLAGRKEEFLWFEGPDGNKEYIHPITLVEFIVAGLKKIQFVQVEKNKLRLNAVIQGDRDATISGIRNRMDEILKKKNLINFVDYEINIVEDIPNDPKTGKYKLIIPFRQT
ncbi:MAG: hypothetical protein PWR01_1821 [Clostridiales bacterium]|nr:hypothetical protein [Clostridiales bacterium]